jgi:predicted TIM-barrel fold metal-dependent hydrolase
VDVWVNLFTEEAMARTANSIVQETAELFDEDGLFRDAAESSDSFIDRVDRIEVNRALIPAMKFDSNQDDIAGVRIKEEEVMEVCATHPDRFNGLVGVDPYDGMDGVRRLERFVREKGFVGAHIVPYGFGLPPNDRRYYPIYAKCAELGVPVMIQIGHTAVRMPNDPGRPKYLDDVALEFPDLDVVAANIGWPWTTEAIALAWTHPNVYIATTGHLPQYWEPEFVEFIRGRGSEKVLWGTNYPTVDIGDSIAEVDDLNLGPDVERRFLSENARAVFEL